MKNIISILFLSSFLFSPSLWADGPSFDDINESEMENIVQDFSSVFTHTSVSPASSLGTIFGVELGLIGGVTSTPGVKSIVNEVSPGDEVSGLPHGGVLLAGSGPFGLGGELLFIPSFDSSEVTLKNTSLAFKWTLTDAFLTLPFDLAVKAFHGNSELSFTQTVSSVTSEVEYKSTTTGALVMGSLNFFIVEPFVGLGMVQTDGSLKATGSTTFFDSSFTSSNEANKKITSTHYLAGVQLNLLIFRLGAEYSRMFDSDRFSAKFSLKF